MPPAPRGSTPRIATVCAGSAWEMGFRQGTDLSAEIVGALETLADLEAYRLKQPWWLPFPAFRWLSANRSRQFLLPALEAHHPEMLDRLRGLADGCGLGLGPTTLLNALEPILSSAEDSSATAAPLGGCSAVGVRGPRSDEGEPVIARNFDYLPLIQPFYTVRESRPSGRFRSLEFTVAALAGALDGVNEQGLAITYDYAFATDPARPAAPISMLISEALGCCRTVDEAIEWFSSRGRWGAGLLMLADESGTLASLELSSSRCQSRRPADGEDLLFHSNRYWTAPMRSVEVNGEAIYNEKAPRALRGCCVLEPSHRRDERFTQLVADGTPLTVDDLARVMADHGDDGTPDDGTICMHSDYWATTACLQWFPRSRRVRLSYSAACEANYVELTLA